MYGPAEADRAFMTFVRKSIGAWNGRLMSKLNVKFVTVLSQLDHISWSWRYLDVEENERICFL